MLNPSKLFYDRMDSPLGVLWIVANETGLSSLFRNMKKTDFLKELQTRSETRPIFNASALSHWRSDLERYFSGEKTLFEGPISFIEGTPFQQKVWRTLRQIPYGEVRSYQWIGEQLSIKHAGRAIGNACGKNPIPILLPCHRVLRQNGALGGYTGGIHIKKQLLTLEGVIDSK